MQFKIDENLPLDARDLLREHGHDAVKVLDQGLKGKADATIASVCRAEHRVILTLDLDFCDVRAYPPDEYSGIVVLRLADQSRPSVLRVLRRIMLMFETENLDGHLWIVSESDVRIRGNGREAD
ncbi:MAG: DUF5615 family PIN-like protein [Planctomycetes bacterium]|nr:DUF5615 family PIN-like protein [Planctomycetota bacterium]